MYNLDFNITTQKNWHTVIDVTIPADKVKPDLDENYHDYQTHAKVGGFRQGKVPMGLIKKMFGDQIEKDTFRPFIADAWQEIFKDENALEKVINEPYITNVIFDDSKGLTFNIEYDVRPEFDLPDYKGTPVEKTEFEIDQQDVDNMLEDLRQRHAMIYTVDGEAQEGHYLLADLQELDDSGVPVIGHKYENQQIWLSKENTELVSQLTGIKSGEDRHIVLTLKDEKDETAEDKKQSFNVTVKEIKERRVPELDDEFAKDVGPYETLKDLTKEVKTNLEAQAKSETRFRFETSLKNELIKLADIEAPPSMVEKYLYALISDYKKRPGGKKTPDEQLREYYGPIAVRNINWLLIHEKLVEKEGISVSDKDVENKIAELENSESDHDKQHASEYKESEEARINLKDQLLEEKVFEVIAKKVKVNTTKKNWRDIYAQPQPEEGDAEELAEASEE